MSDTWNETTPGPDPDRLEANAIHDASGSAVHVQPACVVMVAVIVYDADIHGVNSTGMTEYSQANGDGGTSPAWVIVNVRLPTVMVPVRSVIVLFRSTDYPTEPLPVAVLPDVTPIHDVVLAADHWQWSPALTVNVPVALSLLNEAFAGEMSIVQDACPSSLTVTDWPAIVRVPVRSVVALFGVRLTLTAPSPAPFAPLVMLIQPLSDEAVHVHWAVAVTVTDPAPPAAVNDRDDGETE